METSRTPEEAELLELAITSFLGDLHTAMPGRIEEYFPDTQKANIKPLLKRRIVHEDGSELLEVLPVIPDVPIQFPRSAGFFITFPITKGDLVTLHFMERSIDNYLSSDGIDTDPDEFRMHDLSDAIAVPGFYPFKRSINDINTVNLALGKEDGGIQIHLTPDGTMEVRLGGEADEAVALANTLQTLWESFKTVFDAHVHLETGGTTNVTLTKAPSFDTAIISKILKLKGP